MYSQNELNIQKFEELFTKHIHREGSEDLLRYIRSTDFYTAPASTRFHGSYAGGLVEHSIDVYNELKRILAAYPDVKASEETIAIVSLLHDLCKAEFYKTEFRNAKDESGTWVKVPYYSVDEQFAYGGHGDKSVYLIMKHMKLTDEEAVAIRNHMGNEDGKYTCAGPYEQFPLAFLLHIADESATWYIQRK